MLSPGVEIKEKDLTLIVPNVSSTTGGIAGRFTNGPIGVPYLLSSEAELADVFGPPNDINYPEWFTAAEFLKYSGAMYVVRATATDTQTATQKIPTVGKEIVLKSQTDFEDKLSMSTEFAFGTYGLWASRLPGAIGNSIAVVAVDAGNWVNFSSYASNNFSKYGTSLASLFSQSPKMSGWLQSQMPVGSGAVFSVVTTGGSVSAVNVTKGGSGYSTGTYLEFNGAGSGADFTPTVENGVITKINIKSGGAGYTVAPTVVISAPADIGTGRTATATATLGSGDTATKVVAITIVDGGKNYTASDNIAFTITGSNSEIAVLFVPKLNDSESSQVNGITDGVIVGMTKVSGGINYGTASVTATAFNASLNDELHVMVIDTTGKISGTVNKVLEVYEGLSKVSDASNAFGTDNYYQTVINNNSKYIYWLKSPTDGALEYDLTVDANKLAWDVRGAEVANGTKSFKLFKSTFSKPASLVSGTDGTTVTDGQVKEGYSLLANNDQYEIACFPCAAFSPDVIKHVIENVAYARKDAMAFVSPYNVSTSNLATSKFGLLKTANDIVNFKNIEIAVSDQYAQYAVMDSGWKYMFDKYNNKYRWVPLNGDIAGVVARLELISEPWFSPGGYDRGGIKNVLKLSWNPTQIERDVIYPKGINPVVVLPAGGGVMLYGDRTMTSKPSAFDRINVRRLFNILEKSISTMAKYKLFEINDTFTRSDFKSKVDSYLRDVQGRRGITDYMVRCDETNNTSDVIDRNEFRAAVLCKPARSINFITLSFVAVSTGVAFSTVVGA